MQFISHVPKLQWKLIFHVWSSVLFLVFFCHVSVQKVDQKFIKQNKLCYHSAEVKTEAAGFYKNTTVWESNSGTFTLSAFKPQSILHLYLHCSTGVYSYPLINCIFTSAGVLCSRNVSTHTDCSSHLFISQPVISSYSKVCLFPINPPVSVSLVMDVISESFWCAAQHNLFSSTHKHLQPVQTSDYQLYTSTPSSVSPH